MIYVGLEVMVSQVEVVYGATHERDGLEVSSLGPVGDADHFAHSELRISHGFGWR